MCSCERKTFNCKDITRERIHAKEKRYKCDQCSFASAYKYNLTSHNRRHTGEKPFACSDCEFRTRQKNGLILHQRARHAHKDNGPSCYETNATIPGYDNGVSSSHTGKPVDQTSSALELFGSPFPRTVSNSCSVKPEPTTNKEKCFSAVPDPVHGHELGATEANATGTQGLYAELVYTTLDASEWMSVLSNSTLFPTS